MRLSQFAHEARLFCWNYPLQAYPNIIAAPNELCRPISLATSTNYPALNLHLASCVLRLLRDGVNKNHKRIMFHMIARVNLFLLLG